VISILSLSFLTFSVTGVTPSEYLLYVHIYNLPYDGTKFILKCF